ncbi:hypothetical protein NQZ68_003444 [Dissostichus eleginoides]|nr:hypothetical protein NQZ68_003444 [Dissostichus eleginoides]
MVALQLFEKSGASEGCVYLADNKHMVGKQMTAETEDHNAHSSNTLPRSYSRSTQLLAAR